MKTKIKVRQMTSSKSGQPVANQFIIYTNKGTYFQSYNSIIAHKRAKDGQIFLDECYWDYSRTTSKYRGDYLGEYTAETRQKIKEKKYKLTNLN
tara:strand:+ start:371 stop:652 length:282 start_codon:yes stop_codon:yes gene_type:complete